MHRKREGYIFKQAKRVSEAHYRTRHNGSNTDLTQTCKVKTKRRIGPTHYIEKVLNTNSHPDRSAICKFYCPLHFHVYLYSYWWLPLPAVVTSDPRVTGTAARGTVVLGTFPGDLSPVTRRLKARDKARRRGSGQEKKSRPRTLSQF